MLELNTELMGTELSGRTLGCWRVRGTKPAQFHGVAAAPSALGLPSPTALSYNVQKPEYPQNTH